MIKIKLDEFLSYLEKERINTGEKNPYVFVGQEDYDFTSSIGNYFIEKNNKEIHIISCSKSNTKTLFNKPIKSYITVENKEPKIIAYSLGTRKGNLDDDYKLLDNGIIIHDYDEHTYPGGYNLKRNLTSDQIDISIKDRLYKAANEENKELVRKLLEMDEVIKPEDYLEKKPTYDTLKENYINSVVLSRFYKKDDEYLIGNTFKSTTNFLMEKGIISKEGFDYIISIANKEMEKKYPSDKRKEDDIKNYISQITPNLKKKIN